MIKGEDYTGVCVVYYCHDGEGNFAMNKRSENCRDEKGRWDIGGGAVEFWDTLEKTIRDEIKQEYSTKVLEYEFLGNREVFRENMGKPTHWLTFDYKVLVDKNKLLNGEPHKFDDIGWFRIDNLPSPIHSQLPYFLKKYRNKLII